LTQGSLKGAANERKMARALSSWVTDGQRDDILWRSCASGAQSTHYAKHGSDKYSHQSGDIVATQPEGKELCDLCVVELKHYKDLQIHNVIYGGPCKLTEFWETNLALANLRNKVSLLIVKENYRPILVVYPSFDEPGKIVYERFDEFIKTPYSVFAEKAKIYLREKFGVTDS
jgi:hypothetical protein